MPLQYPHRDGVLPFLRRRISGSTRGDQIKRYLLTRSLYWTYSSAHALALAATQLHASCCHSLSAYPEEPCRACVCVVVWCAAACALARAWNLKQLLCRDGMGMGRDGHAAFGVAGGWLAGLSS